MKKSVLTILIVFLCMLAGSVFAQTRTVVTLGGTWWGAAYNYQASYEDNYGTTDSYDIAEIGAGNSFGPYVSINHGKVNFGASLLFGSFPVDAFKAYLGQDYGFDDLDTYTDEIDFSRTDLNFTVGYRILPNINVFLGAKYLKWAVEASPQYDLYDYSGSYIATFTNYEESKDGMMYGVGIAAVLPLGSEGLYAFGSLAGMGGTLTHVSDATFVSYTEYSANDESDISAALVAINLGAGYRFPSGLGINVGYRADIYAEDLEAQYYDYDLGQSVTIKTPSTSVQGLILTCSYSF